jgi:ABC-type phosphate/phosphonate transport system substrate-binding protein
VVIRADLDGGLKARLRTVFLEMDHDPKGQEILRQLMIRRFVPVADALYHSIRQMLQVVGRTLPRTAGAAPPVGR